MVSATPNIPDGLLKWSREHTTDMVHLLKQLVEIESPSTDPAAVALLATRLARDLEALGLVTELVPVPGGGPVLKATTAGAPQKRRTTDEIHDCPLPVLLLGHLDTVWPLGTVASRPVRIDGNVFRGPGSYDMKAGLVVAVWALRALAAQGFRPHVTVFFTPLEEVDCSAYRALMESEMSAAAAVLDFEPAWPGGAVKTERKGSGSFFVRAHGKAAHAGADVNRGANAIVELARQILDVTHLADPARGVTVNPGVIKGGIRSNVVPDFAEAEVDFRVRTLDDGRRLETAAHALRAHDRAVRLEIEGGLHYPPMERSAHVLQVFEKARDVARALGLTLEEVSSGGASEASFAAALGVPTLDGLGADGDGAHAESEHVLIHSLPERVALAAGLIYRLATDEACKPTAPRA